MAKYVWVTDCHLDFLNSDDKIVNFAQGLLRDNPIGVFITGDISISTQLIYHLSIVERVVQRPIFFVAGNHDYYRNSIEDVRKAMRELTNQSQFLRYMPLNSYIALTPQTAIVGHDGWYDAGYGDAKASQFMMTDWLAIKEFVDHSGGREFVSRGNLKDRPGLITLAKKLATEGTLHVQNGIKHASRYHKTIVVLTHFPPFKEAHVYNGAPGDEHALPWYTNKIMGDMLLDAARTYPHINFIVLAGHTHGGCTYQPMKNLTVRVGQAEYGSPAAQGAFELP